MAGRWSARSKRPATRRETLNNSWDKNDPRDAQVLLHMLRIGATQHYHDPLPRSSATILCHDPLRADIDDVQELTETHEAISRAKTAIQHRILTHYLPLYFPEVERFRGNSRSDWFFAFLEQFPTPEEHHRPEPGDIHRRGRRPAALRPSPPVPRVLRPRSCHLAIRPVPRPDRAAQVRQCETATDALARRSGRHPSTRQRLSRQVRALYRPRSAQRRSQAQGADRYHRLDGARGSA